MIEKALLLVDFEQEWIDKDSVYYVGDIAEVINKVNRLIDYCRERDYKIIFTTHVEPDSKDAFAGGSPSVEVITALNKEDGDVLIAKNKISPFYKTNLENELEGVKSITVCGILTNLCVRSAIQDAYDRDYDITVIKDCCVAFDAEIQKFTFKDLKDTRGEVEFIELNEYL